MGQCIQSKTSLHANGDRISTVRIAGFGWRRDEVRDVKYGSVERHTGYYPSEEALKDAVRTGAAKWSRWA